MKEVSSLVTMILSGKFTVEEVFVDIWLIVQSTQSIEKHYIE